MKIAHLGTKGLPSKGGAERVVEAITARLVGSHDLAVYCSTGCTPADTQIPGIRLIRIQALPGKHLQPLSLFVLSAIHAIVRGAFDLVHVHNAEASFVVPLLRLRYPVIVTSHGPAHAREKWGPIAKRLIQLSDYFYAWFPDARTSVSAPLAEEYRHRFGGDTYYVPNGVESQLPVDKGAGAAILRKSGIGTDYILFSAGRLDPSKGCHLLLQAFAQLKDGIHLAIVGNLMTVPRYGEQLRGMADRRVKFIPFIEAREVLFAIVRGARLFVFPSTVEGMSMMLLEVASLGVPIVCSRRPENTQVVADHALYFESGDVRDLTRKLRWALDNGESMRALGEAAQRHVKRHYSWDAIARRYDSLYRQVVLKAHGHSFR